MVTRRPLLSVPLMPIFANEYEGSRRMSPAPGWYSWGLFLVTTCPPMVSNTGLPTSVALWPRIVTERVIVARLKIEV